MSNLHRIENFYSLAMRISAVIPKLQKKLRGKVSLFKKMVNIPDLAFVFEKVPVGIPPEFYSHR